MFKMLVVFCTRFRSIPEKLNLQKHQPVVQNTGQGVGFKITVQGLRAIGLLTNPPPPPAARNTNWLKKGLLAESD